jgi:hypothetical protein
MEARMNELYEKMGEATEEEMAEYMEETGTIQDLLTNHDFYMIDAKVEEVARALGLLDLGLERDVTELSGGQRTKILLGKLLLEKPDILMTIEYSEEKNRVTAVICYGGRAFDLTQSDDVLALAMLKSAVEEIRYEWKEGEMRGNQLSMVIRP